MAKWTVNDIPDQTGRTVVVTGANSGLGAVTAKALAGTGAHVVLACRNVEKGKEAAADMPGRTEVRKLNLADLASIRSFAEGTDGIDVLINNAGVMALPRRSTADGFEMQIGTNHLGHFALTGLLLDRVRDRVVTLSSAAHQVGKIDLDDLNWERRSYSRWPAYGQSKLANLLFTFELQRRLTASGSTVKSLAAHPGYASTNLQAHTESVQDRLMSVGNRLLAQSAEMGALPELYAATVSELEGGTYIGPDGFMQQHGSPEIVGSSKASKNVEVARGLWDLSEQLTGVKYTF